MSTANAVSNALIVRNGCDRHDAPMHIVGTEITVKISSADTGGAFAVMEGITPPLSGPPLHCHPNQDEWWYIVEGRFRFVVDGERIEAGPGDTVFAPRGTHHTFQNIGDTPAVSVVTVVPGGLDVFFADLAEAVPRGAAPDAAKLLPVFEKHGMELLGPPLSARP